MTDKNLLRDQILDLKEKRNAVILAHNYQRDEIQDLANFTGDSLELSQKAADTDADVIVFCGVNFMAESASILSPDKTVLLPEIEANCPMADMIQVRAPLPELQKAAVESGMKLLAHSAMDKACEHLTSLEEVVSITVLEEE